MFSVSRVPGSGRRALGLASFRHPHRPPRDVARVCVLPPASSRVRSGPSRALQSPSRAPRPVFVSASLQKAQFNFEENWRETLRRPRPSGERTRQVPHVQAGLLLALTHSVFCPQGRGEWTEPRGQQIDSRRATAVSQALSFLRAPPLNPRNSSLRALSPSYRRGD